MGASLALLGVSVWATGGAASFLVPYLACTLLYIAYFFPPRHSWPLGAGVVAVVFSPLLYAEAPTAGAFLPGRSSPRWRSPRSPRSCAT